jgi:hypothetical protein
LIFLIYGTRDCLDFFGGKERNNDRNLIFLEIYKELCPIFFVQS